MIFTFGRIKYKNEYPVNLNTLYDMHQIKTWTYRILRRFWHSHIYKYNRSLVFCQHTLRSHRMHLNFAEKNFKHFVLTCKIQIWEKSPTEIFPLTISHWLSDDGTLENRFRQRYFKTYNFMWFFALERKQYEASKRFPSLLLLIYRISFIPYCT